MPEAAEAWSIYQAHLDATSEAIWEGALDAAAALSVYPHRMETSDAVAEIADPATRVAFLRDVRESLSRLGATAFIRVCREAAFGAPDRIDGTYMTYALRGATPVIKPYAVTMPLHLRGDYWLSGDAIAVVGNAEGRLITPLHGLEPKERAGGANRTPARRTR